MSEHINTEGISPAGSRVVTSDRSDIATDTRQASPVGMGLIPLGFAFGLLIAQTGFSWWWAPIFSIVAYAGLIGFPTIGLVMVHTGLLGCAVASPMVSFRHVLCGLAFPHDRVQPRLSRAYSTCVLTDESHSIAPVVNPDEKMSGRRLLTIQIFCQLPWVGPGIVGSLTGVALPGGIRGAEFALVTLLTVLAMDVFETSKDWSLPLSVTVCTLVGWLINPNQMLAIGLLTYFGMLLLRVWSPRVDRVICMTLLSKGRAAEGERA